MPVTSEGTVTVIVAFSPTLISETLTLMSNAFLSTVIVAVVELALYFSLPE